LSKSRVETLSDGIFAIAITLLVLTIPQPGNYNELGSELAKRWPSVAAYVVSFGVIGIMWLNHHSVFGRFERVDRGLFYLNLFLLLTIVFIPYPTGVLGEALRRGQGARVAAVAYSATMAINGYAWAAIWLYGTRRRRLLAPSFPDAALGPATARFTIGSVLYTISVGVGFINAYACLGFHALLAVYYALDPLSRRGSSAPDADPFQSS
jgi:uncharacterized membrane protein